MTCMDGKLEKIICTTSTPLIVCHVSILLRVVCSPLALKKYLG